MGVLAFGGWGVWGMVVACLLRGFTGDFCKRVV